jgi:hypothetical protein
MRPSLFTAPVLVVFGMAGQLAAADVSMVNLLMPDAKMISGVDVERSRNSPFGQYFIKQMAVKDSGLERFTELTGLDPRRDVLEIMVASSDVGVASLRGGTATVVIVRGAFNPSKVLQLAAAHGSIATYNGTQVVETAHGADSAWVGFLGNLLVAGPQAGVKSAIDRYRSAKKADALLATRIQSASSKHDAWLLTTLSPAAFAGDLSSNPNVKGAMSGDLVKGIESITAGVKFGANVIMSGEATARSDKDAMALVDVMRFFATMAQSNGAKSGPMGLLDAVQMNADGRTVKFSLTTPEQEFEKLFAPGMRRAKARARTMLD